MNSKGTQATSTPQPAAVGPAVQLDSPIPKRKSKQKQTGIYRQTSIQVRSRRSVHGSGRINPNRADKPPASARLQPAVLPLTTRIKPPQPAAPACQPPAIDHIQPLLYSSDECRLADSESVAGPDIDYNSECHRSLNPHAAALLQLAEPVITSSRGISSPQLETSSDSTKAFSLATGPTSIQRKSQPDHAPSSYTALALIYDLPPCPPPPPFTPHPKPQPAKENPSAEYTSGIIMAARRMQSMLGPQGKRRTIGGAQEVIPGWTDGSNKWRPSMYSFARHDKDVDVSSDGVFDNRNNAYRGFISTPCKSCRRSIADGSLGRATSHTPQALARALAEAEELYSKCDMSFASRCESRATAFPNNMKKIPRAILKQGAEGLLLVPKVQMKRRDPAVSGGRCLVSKQGGEGIKSDEMHNATSSPDISTKKACSLPAASEPWYQDEPFLYPILSIPRREKQLIRKVVDGKDVIEEVVIEVYPERKRLFLFPGRNQG